VYKGCLNKFHQNPQLLTILKSTGNSIIVEASPKDTIWGIGMNVKSALSTHPTNWKGYNLLGQVLIKVRTDLSR